MTEYMMKTDKNGKPRYYKSVDGKMKVISRAEYEENVKAEVEEVKSEAIVPAVVVSNQQNNRYGEVVEVIYLTTAPKRDLPTHVTIRSSGRVSTALCEQISTVSVERLGSYCGHVSDSELTAIENAMLISLGIQLAPVSEESEETPPCRNHGSPKSKLGAASCRSYMMLCWTGSSRLDENIKKPHAAQRAA